MMNGMTRPKPANKGAIVLLSLILLGSTASSARADDEEIQLDARMEGYATKVDIGGSTALTSFLLMVLTGLSLGVMFKDAKRSHLD